MQYIIAFDKNSQKSYRYQAIVITAKLHVRSKVMLEVLSYYSWEISFKKYQKYPFLVSDKMLLIKLIELNVSVVKRAIEANKT